MRDEQQPEQTSLIVKLLKRKQEAQEASKRETAHQAQERNERPMSEPQKRNALLI